MKKTDYKCPYDVTSMPKTDGNYYCGSCQKVVFDLTQLTDRQVVNLVSGIKSSACIHIQKNRLSLITDKIGRWKLLIFLLLNFKTFFLQKVYSQTTNSLSTSHPQAKIGVRTLTGKVTDVNTGKTVSNPTIELYKSNTFIQQVQGDKDGNFILYVRGNLNQADTISLKIYSESYIGTLIKNLPLTKVDSMLEAKIPGNGPMPDIIIPKHRPSDSWTGRLLE